MAEVAPPSTDARGERGQDARGERSVARGERSESEPIARSLSRPLAAAVVALYVLAFPYHPQLRSPNELCRLWQARAIVEFGTLSVNRANQTFGPVGDLSVKDGLLYPSKAPLLSFAAVPVYAALRALGGGFVYAVPELAQVYWSRFFLTVLPTLGMLILIRRFLAAYVHPNVADAVTATYALGTLAFSYSLLFMSHQSTAVLLFASFYALWRCSRGEWRERGYLTAGLCAGAAVAAEYTAGLGIAALVLYAALTWLLQRELPLRQRWIRVARAAGLATLGALPVIAALMAYHTVCFGHPFETGYVNLNDPGYQGWHLGGLFGIRTPDPRAFALSFFSPLRGLIPLSPVLLAAIPGMVFLYRSPPRLTLGVNGAETLGVNGAQTLGVNGELRAMFWLSASLALGYAYFTSSFSYESWGWTTGPRHMTGLIPFLLLPIALVLDVPSLWTNVTAGLAAASVLVTGALTMVNYIPPEVNNAMFGLAVPLFAAGYTPPTALGWLLPNPLAGALMLVLIAVAAALVVLALAPRGRSFAIASGVCAAYLLLLFAIPHNTPGDTGTVAFLKSQWLAPPGSSVHLWPGRSAQ